MVKKPVTSPFKNTCRNIWILFLKLNNKSYYLSFVIIGFPSESNNTVSPPEVPLLTYR